MTTHRVARAPVAIIFIGLLLAGVDLEARTTRGEAAADALFDLQSFVDKAVARGESRITLPSGRHRVAPKRGVHLQLSGLRDTTLIANGFELVCTQTTRAIEIEGCSNVTVSGLTIDYDPLPYTQGRIVKLSADRTIHEVEIFDGYPDTRGVTTKKYQVFRGDDHTLRWVDYYDPTIEVLGAKRLRIIKKQRGPEPEEEVGDCVVIGSTTSVARTLPHAVVLQSCDGVRLEGVTVYASNCFAFLENDCDRSEYLRCRVAKRGVDDDLTPREAPRLRSTNADAFHSKRATQGPQIVGCYAHYQGDDCVNINGDYHLVSRVTQRRLRVLAKHSMDIRKGDVAELTQRDGEVQPDARVISIKEIGPLSGTDRTLLASLNLHPTLKSHAGGRLSTVYEIVLDRPVELEPGSLIAAANRRGNGFRVSGCDFGHVRSRGIIAKASDGEISGNRLTACRAESIKLAAEPFWLESGSVSNVRIHKNTIADCGSVAIAVYAWGDARGFAEGNAHREITISENVVSRSPLPNFFVSSTDALRLEGNQSRASAEAASSSHSLLRSVAGINNQSKPVLLHRCRDVLMHANTIQ